MGDYPLSGWGAPTERRTAKTIRGSPVALQSTMRARMGERAFTLIELMMVIAVLGVLSTMALQQYELMVAKSKRVEAFAGLSGLWTAERSYFSSNNRYSGSFDELAFTMEGGTRLSASQIKGNRYTFSLSQPWGPSSWYCIANGQIDGDPWVDGVEIFDGRP